MTFFAFLGFGVVTFTAKDLTNPSRQLPRAIYLALGIATTIYVAVALGVFGTLTVDKVIESGGTALAVAAEPTLGRAGYWLMSVTALFSTAGATNAGLYPAAGLLITAAAAIVLAAGFDLSSIASLGSAIALLVFTLITAAHFRVRAETGASTLVLSIAITSTVVVLLTFAFTTLVDEPAAAVALVVILLLSVALDVGWKRARDRRIWSLYQRGRLVLVGLPADNELRLPIFETVLNGIQVLGSIVGTRVDLAEVFELHARGRTHVTYQRRPLESVNESFADVLAGQIPARIVLDPGSVSPTQ